MVILLLLIHRETDMRNSILAQVLDQSARARCKCALKVIFWSLEIFLWELSCLFFLIFFFFSEQSCFGEAGEGQCS